MMTLADLGMLKGEGHIVWVYMYMERSDGPRADADTDSYTHILRLNNLGTRPQERSGNGESDRSCTVYANEQHQYWFRL